MAIVTNAGPENASSIIEEALSQFSAVATKHSVAPGLGRSGSPLGGALPSFSEPVQVYLLQLEDVRPGFDLKSLESAAKPIGWRYVIVNGGRATITADVKSSASQNASFGRINAGPVPTQLAAAAEKATELFGSSDPEIYGVRLLEIPSLSKQTLWLHGPTHDHFLPYWPPAVDGQIREETQFLENLVQRAQEHLAVRGSSFGGTAPLSVQSALDILPASGRSVGENTQPSIQSAFDSLQDVAALNQAMLGGTAQPQWTTEQLKSQYQSSVQRGWITFFANAAIGCGFDVSVLLGIASRESNIQQIVGDGGHGHGIMQIDDRFHPDFIDSGAWKQPDSNIEEGATILETTLKTISASQGKMLAITIGNKKINFVGKPLSQQELLRTAIAAYNAGGRAYYYMSLIGSPDIPTTGGNYSKDVLDRASIFTPLVSLAPSG
jgi:Transglycosylase SLT domain